MEGEYCTKKTPQKFLRATRASSCQLRRTDPSNTITDQINAAFHVRYEKSVSFKRMLIFVNLIGAVFVDGRHEIDYAHHSGRNLERRYFEDSEDKLFKPLR